MRFGFASSVLALLSADLYELCSADKQKRERLLSNNEQLSHVEETNRRHRDMLLENKKRRKLEARDADSNHDKQETTAQSDARELEIDKDDSRLDDTPDVGILPQDENTQELEQVGSNGFRELGNWVKWGKKPQRKKRSPGFRGVPKDSSKGKGGGGFGKGGRMSGSRKNGGMGGGSSKNGGMGGRSKNGGAKKGGGGGNGRGSKNRGGNNGKSGYSDKRGKYHRERFRDDHYSDRQKPGRRPYSSHTRRRRRGPDNVPTETPTTFTPTTILPTTVPTTFLPTTVPTIPGPTPAPIDVFEYCNVVPGSPFDCANGTTAYFTYEQNAYLYTAYCFCDGSCPLLSTTPSFGYCCAYFCLLTDCSLAGPSMDECAGYDKAYFGIP